MTANQNQTPMTFEDLVAMAKNGIALIVNPEAVKLMELQIAHAEADKNKPLWRGWDVRLAVMIALVRDLAERLPLRADECRSAWPKDRFESTFETPRKAGNTGWLEHISSQVGDQVKKFAKADLKVIALKYDQALTMKTADRENLSRAIDNALDLIEVMDPAAGVVFTKMDELKDLRDQMAAKVEECRLSWPKDRFVDVFETPHGEDEKAGWLENVQSKVSRVLETRQPKLEWVERAIEAVQKLEKVLRPAAPYFCRKCYAILPDGKFKYCNSCHSKWTSSSKATSRPQTFRKSNGYSLADGQNVTPEELEKIVAELPENGVGLLLKDRKPVKSGQDAEIIAEFIAEFIDDASDQPEPTKVKRVAVNPADLAEEALVASTEPIPSKKRRTGSKK